MRRIAAFLVVIGAPAAALAEEPAAAPPVVVPVAEPSATLAEEPAAAPPSAVPSAAPVATLAEGWTTVDPQVEQDDDFARNRGSPLWADLVVGRRELPEDPLHPQFYRIARADGKPGPTWIVPHDDEDAGFDTALAAVARYGGIAITVDSKLAGRDGCRMLALTCSSAANRYDPNRRFGTAGGKAYTDFVTAQFAPGEPVIALHTNRKGLAGACDGAGNISMYRMSAARKAKCHEPGADRLELGAFWGAPGLPEGASFYGDGDSMVWLPVPTRSPAAPEGCGAQLAAAGVNLRYESVVSAPPGDGSLSNWVTFDNRAREAAATAGGGPPAAPTLYFNVETGSVGDLAQQTARQLAMVSRVLALCVPQE